MSLFKFDPNSSKRYRIEKWQWAAHVPAVVFLYFVFPKTWDRISILYLALVSIYALVATADGNEESARSKELLKAEEHDR